MCIDQVYVYMYYVYCLIISPHTVHVCVNTTADCCMGARCRFDGATKNYKLYYDTNLLQHYVGDKYFEYLDDLVADGLICFFVHLKAPDYIASMNTESHYEESPYMR